MADPGYRGLRVIGAEGGPIVGLPRHVALAGGRPRSAPHELEPVGAGGPLHRRVDVPEPALDVVRGLAADRVARRGSTGGGEHGEQDRARVGAHGKRVYPAARQRATAAYAVFTPCPFARAAGRRPRRRRRLRSVFRLIPSRRAALSWLPAESSRAWRSSGISTRDITAR